MWTKKNMMKLNTSSALKISIRDYPTACSPYQSGVMVYFTYVPQQDILTSVKYPVPSNIMNVMLFLNVEPSPEYSVLDLIHNL